jgi:hypothetical protein
MFGSDHASKMASVAKSERESFNLGGDLSLALVRRILIRTEHRLDLGLDECVQISKELVMEEPLRSAVSVMFCFQEGYDRTASILAWASYIASLHVIAREAFRGMASLSEPQVPSREQVERVKSFIDQEIDEDSGELPILMEKLKNSIRTSEAMTEN